MSRLILPTLAALLLCAAPAPAQVLSASKDDPAERPSDSGRDIQSISSTFDPAGTWTVAVRFYGAPTARTSALLRSHLGVVSEDGSCQKSSPGILVAAHTDPAGRGGRGFVDGYGFDIVKTVDEDGRGFRLTFSNQRLAQRGVCGIAGTTLSRNEPFDSVGAFAFPGGAAEPPAQPQPEGDTAAPTARMRILRDPKALRRGVVRVSVRDASEPLLIARATLYGDGHVLDRAGKRLSPGQEVRLRLELGRRALKRLKRTGRLPVRVVTMLVDRAGNDARIRARTILRVRRR